MKTNFYIISKTTQNFSDYLSRTIRLSDKKPQTVREVILGKKGKVEGKIATFLDSDGNVIEKAFNFKGKPLRNRIYSYKTIEIGENEFVKSTEIKEYTLKRNIIEVYRKYQQKVEKLNIKTTLWEQEKIQTNHVATNILENIKHITISRIKNLKTIQKEFLHSFTQYKPIVNNKIDHNSPIKYIEYVVNDKFNAFKETIYTLNMKKPKFDSFLGFRALSLEDFKIPITEKFLRDRGIKHLNYKIVPDAIPQDINDTWRGLFGDGIISFRKSWIPKSKSEFASTARHEVEHGWQYYLDARNGGNRGDFLLGIGEKYGKLTDPNLQKEANEYTKSINNYVPAKKDYKKYLENYIEIKANEAGAKARKKYEKQGKLLREEFKHIPPEML